MSSPKTQDDQSEEAYLASYEASNRKRKILIVVVAIIAIAGVAAAFLGTIGSLGKMNENVQGAFTENPDGTPAEKAPQDAEGQTPAAQEPVEARSEAEAPAPVPTESQTTPPADATPPSSEPSPEVAP